MRKVHVVYLIIIMMFTVVNCNSCMPRYNVYNSFSSYYTDAIIYANNSIKVDTLFVDSNYYMSMEVCRYKYAIYDTLIVDSIIMPQAKIYNRMLEKKIRRFIRKHYNDSSFGVSVSISKFYDFTEGDMILIQLIEDIDRYFYFNSDFEKMSYSYVDDFLVVFDYDSINVDETYIKKDKQYKLFYYNRAEPKYILSGGKTAIEYFELIAKENGKGKCTDWKRLIRKYY